MGSVFSNQAPIDSILPSPCVCTSFHGSQGKAGEPKSFWPNLKLQSVQATWTQNQWNTPGDHSLRMSAGPLGF